MKKQALTPRDKFDLLGLSIIPAAIGSSAILTKILEHQSFKGPPLQHKDVLKLARKHLGRDVIVQAVPGMQNASYQKIKTPSGRKMHYIRYDPRAGKSIITHEIGHGMGGVPRVPGAGIVAPVAMLGGAFEAGAAGGLGRPMGRFWPAAGLVGAAAWAPTALDEALASRRAKKILKGMGEKPEGLGTALGTYLLPYGLAGGFGAGAYALGRKIRGRPLLSLLKRGSVKDVKGYCPLQKLAAKKDAPNYRPSTGAKTCANCSRFKPVGTCNKYSFKAKSTWVCDGWET